MNIQRPDLPATFECLNDDTLTTTLQFVGDKSYKSFGGTNKRCREVYLSSGMTKKTFLYGYGPLTAIKDKCENAQKVGGGGWGSSSHENAPSKMIHWGSSSHSTVFESVGKGVLFFNRRDVMDWALQEKKSKVLKAICNIAAQEGKLDILNEVWNNVDNENDKRSIFGRVDSNAARGGKLNVLMWFETKGLDINESFCAYQAASGGHLHIIQWLQEEKGWKLDGELYGEAVWGGHFHVMMWLREQGCPFQKRSRWGESSPFSGAAEGGNLDILQWLHDEGCPWPEDHHVPESQLKPEVIEWVQVNGYGHRIIVGW